MKNKALDSIKPAHHIPVSSEDILSKFMSQLKGSETEDARKFFKLLKNQIHLEFHQTMEELDLSYEPFNPNSIHKGKNQEPDSSIFADHLKFALEKANYKELGQAELDEAFEEASLFKIRLHVDFTDYKQTVIFSRGESVRKENVYLFGRFFKREIEFINYNSVVIFLHFNDEMIDASLKESCKPGSVVLKMFQNVPKADLEMLFPNTKIRMRLKDKLMIGIPAVVSGIIIAATKLGASFILLGALMGAWLGFSDEPVTLNKTSLLALLAGFGTLGGYLWKQFSGFNNRKLKFIQKLTENLYFKNLDNNEGVYYRLINEAEKEECKEVLLAYFDLLKSEKPKNSKDLDVALELWLEKTWGCNVDFDVEDAIQKLETLNLINRAGSAYTAVNLPDAIKTLDERWDNYFSA